MKLKKVKRGIHVAEAFMVRHNPQWIERAEPRRRRARSARLRAIQVFFTYYLDDPNNIRNMAKIGGGGMLDIGCYPITIARFVFDAEPKRVIALIDRDPKFKTDRTASGIADFGNGRQLTFTVSTQTAPYQRAHIGGTKGRIEVEIPFNAPPDEPNRLFLQGMEMNKGEMARIAGQRSISDAGGSLRPRHPQEGKAETWRRRCHPEHEDHRCLLPLGQSGQVGEAVIFPLPHALAAGEGRNRTTRNRNRR